MKTPTVTTAPMALMPEVIRLRWMSACADEHLKSIATANAMLRGRTYAASGAVVLGKTENEATRPILSATVNGTEAYQTRIGLTDDPVDDPVNVHDDEGLDGDCTCASAQSGWFCKHQVALAMVWRATLEGKPIELDAAAQQKVATAAKRAQTVKDNEQALRDFVLRQDAASLAKELLELAERYREVHRDLQQWRKINTARAKSTDLKPVVNEILATGRRFLDWRESRDYYARAMAVIPLLQRARNEDAQAAISLTLHAMRRAWLVLDQADDSNGDISGVCEAIGAEWVAAISAAGEQSASFADSYLKTMLDDPFGCFDSYAVEAAMGQAALTRYRKLVAAEWQKAVNACAAEETAEAATAATAARDRMHHAPRPALTDSYFHMKTLERLHLNQLQAGGDHEAVLSLYRAAAASGDEHGADLRVVTYLEKIGREREALAEAEKLARQHPGDCQVQTALLRAYERDGYVDEALAIRRARFDAAPSVAHFKDVLQAAKHAGHNEATAREEIWNALAERELLLQKQPASKFAMHYAAAGASPGARNVSLRAEILCAEKRWLDALALVQPPHACGAATLQSIAKHLPTSHAEDAVKLLIRAFEGTMPMAQTPYKDVLAIASEIAKRMSPEQRTRWLDGLYTRYRAKRNFIAGLPSP